MLNHCIASIHVISLLPFLGIVLQILSPVAQNVLSFLTDRIEHAGFTSYYYSQNSMEVEHVAKWSSPSYHAEILYLEFKSWLCLCCPCQPCVYVHPGRQQVIGPALDSGKPTLDSWQLAPVTRGFGGRETVTGNSSSVPDEFKKKNSQKVIQSINCASINCVCVICLIIL